MDSWLHQTMIDELENLGVKNEVFVPVYSNNGHIVIPNKNVNVAVCFKKLDRMFYNIKQKKIKERVKQDFNIKEFWNLHAYTVFTDGNVARNLSKEFGIPYVVAVRNTDVNVFFKYMIHLRKTGVNVLKDAKAVFFLSNSYQKQVIETYIPLKYQKEILLKSYIIPNGIDFFWHENLYNSYQPLAKMELFKKQKLTLIYAGVIDKNKNITTTCEAIKILECEGWEIKFIVVGEIKNNGVFAAIKKFINYVEPKAKEDLINIFRESDIFIMPSHTETFGLVYAEAMSQGLPVLYTKGQGFDGQFLDGVVGYAVSDTDAKDISEKIKKCVFNYEKLRENCLTLVDKFKWNQICEIYKSIYQEKG